MKQRGSFAIKILILEAAKNRPLSKTRIMQALVLNYSRAMRYTTALVEQGLLEYDPATKTFQTTRKGSEFLELSENLASYLSPVDKLITRYRSYLDEGSTFMPEHDPSLHNSTMPGSLL